MKLGSTAWGWLLAGQSYLRLFFKSAERKRTSVLGRCEEKDAGYCDACGTLIVQGKRSQQVECPACAASIPPGHQNCPQCGKEYRAPHRPVEY